MQMTRLETPWRDKGFAFRFNLEVPRRIKGFIERSTKASHIWSERAKTLAYHSSPSNKMAIKASRSQAW